MSQKKFDALNIAIGVLIALAAQGIYDAIFYYAKGDILEDSIVILITAMVVLLTTTIILTLWLSGRLKVGRETTNPQSANRSEKITEPKPKPEPKQPKPLSTKQWVAIAVISGVLTIIFAVISIPFGIFLLLSSEALKALIEAMATILGFFGLVAIYLLTSYDSRIDKIEEKIMDLGEWEEEKVKHFRVIQNNLKTRKNNSMKPIVSSLCCLFISLFLSILILSILNISPTDPGIVGVIGIFLVSMLLFIGVLSIVAMIYKIGKEPE
jgi:uncharacterized membrane protein